MPHRRVRSFPIRYRTSRRALEQRVPVRSVHMFLFISAFGMTSLYRWTWYVPLVEFAPRLSLQLRHFVPRCVTSKPRPLRLLVDTVSTNPSTSPIVEETANRALAKYTLSSRVPSFYDTSKSSAELRSSPLTTYSLRVASTTCRSHLEPSPLFVAFSKGVSRVNSNRRTPCC
ncbi:hypothetical protein IEO21_10867 [Rhodonia placenta]|uniref:Transmembrane protein n=1 Tax=Rhodonia placenta TaxID=104341 RepID=A0A8H7TWX3_9APHY|nr:hypothetical protein IEO21_10867 [Postia placenta]